MSDPVAISTPFESPFYESPPSGGGGGNAAAIVGSSVAAAASLLPLFFLSQSKAKAPVRRPVQQQPAYQPQAPSSPYKWPLIAGAALLVGVGIIALLSRE